MEIEVHGYIRPVPNGTRTPRTSLTSKNIQDRIVTEQEYPESMKCHPLGTVLSQNWGGYPIVISRVEDQF